MCDFYIFFKEDMLIVNIFTTTYFLYCFLHGWKKESGIAKMGVLFLFSFYCFFFLLSSFLSILPIQDIRSIARFIIIPTITIFIFLLPIKLGTKTRRGILLFLSCYILFYFLIIIWHYFSSM